MVTAADVRVEAPAVSPASVVAPVTPRVVPTVAAPVTSADASVDAPALSTPSVEVPVTPRVPDRVILVRAISASRSIVTSSFRSPVVIFVPPVTLNVSVRRSTSSKPVSAATLRLVPISVVVAEVMRPFESTLITGT